MSGRPIEQPAVSVVMPAYNAARTITDAIDSVLHGTFEDFEIVICDDASHDDTAAIVKAYDDPRIRLIHSPVNRGEGAARDHAIDSSKGHWIAVLDADDAYVPERLQILVDAARTHPDCIVFDEVMKCHDTPDGIRPWRSGRSYSAFPGPRNQARKVTVADWISQQWTGITPLIPASLIRRHGVRHSDKRCSADLEYFLKLIGLSRAELWYVPQAMYLYRINPGSMSTVADRHALTASTLHDAIALFCDDPLTAAALRQAEKDQCRKREYHQFFVSVVRFNLRTAGALALNKPWVVLEFLLRSMKQIPYHLHRWRHQGRWQKKV